MPDLGAVTGRGLPCACGRRRYRKHEKWYVCSGRTRRRISMCGCGQPIEPRSNACRKCYLAREHARHLKWTPKPLRRNECRCGRSKLVRSKLCATCSIEASRNRKKPILDERICLGCSRTFSPRPYDGGRGLPRKLPDHCSRGCAIRNRPRKATSLKPKRARPALECQVCGQPCPPKRRICCSGGCYASLKRKRKREWYRSMRPVPTAKVDCFVCGSAVPDRRRTPVCSTRCEKLGKKYSRYWTGLSREQVARIAPVLRVLRASRVAVYETYKPADEQPLG